jgi:hypothetical protein
MSRKFVKILYDIRNISYVKIDNELFFHLGFTINFCGDCYCKDCKTVAQCICYVDGSLSKNLKNDDSQNSMQSNIQVSNVSRDYNLWQIALPNGWF